MQPAPKNAHHVCRPQAISTTTVSAHTQVPSNPSPRPKVYSSAFQAGVHQIRMLCRRVILAIKNCTLSERAQIQARENVKNSISEWIAKNHDFMTFPTKLNAMCQKAEAQAIDIPSLVYETLGPLKSSQLDDVSKNVSNETSLKWLTFLISELKNSRDFLAKSLEEGLGKSGRLFNQAEGVGLPEQKALWEELEINCESKAVWKPDLEVAIIKTIRSASVGQLASLLEPDKSDVKPEQHLLSQFKEAAVKEIKTRGEPFLSGWLEMSDKERDSIGVLISGNDDFAHWKAAYESEVKVARLMKQSDDEILNQEKTSEKISYELQCVVRLRMQRLADKGVYALNRALASVTGSLKSPCHIIPALLIFGENMKTLSKYKEKLGIDWPLKLDGILYDLKPQERQRAISCLKFAVDVLSKAGKISDERIVNFCSACFAGECSDADAESIRRSMARHFPKLINSESKAIPKIEVAAKIKEELTNAINEEVKRVIASEGGSNKKVSNQFIRDLRTYHFNIVGKPFDSFNPSSKAEAEAIFVSEMKSAGRNEIQSLAVSEILSQTTGNLIWNSILAEHKLLGLTQDEIDTGEVDTKQGAPFFTPGTPVQEQFVTQNGVELHFYAEYLDRLGVTGSAVATFPEETHCLIKVSLTVDPKGGVLVSDIDVRFSRKVKGNADEIE